MSKEIEIYTGLIKYKNIEFTFMFDGKKLRLIPPKSEKIEIKKWFFKSLGNGIYTIGDPVYIEEKELIGNCNETGNRIIFFPKHTNIIIDNNILIVNINVYIIEKYERDRIDRISFNSQEIDCVFSVNRALEFPKWNNDGIILIETKNFDDTTTKKEQFNVDGRDVYVNFGISRKSSLKVGDPPLKLYSEMYFEFEQTNDYDFIIKLCNIARNFIEYLCYRKNISVMTIELSAPYDNNMHEKFATLHIVSDDVDNEKEILERGQYIKYEYIKENEGKILTDIANDKIYSRHIPENYKRGHIIDASRFVMITAAFEWTFDNNFPNGITKKDKTIKAEAKAKLKLTKLINKSTGKIKEIYKFLFKLIGKDTLQSKIEAVDKEYGDIITIFGENLYKINNEVLKYNEMGLRISKQRNNFAHGNLDKDFIGLSLLDLMYLEYIIYAMQLKQYGVDNELIKKAINDLFGCNLDV